MLTHDCLGGCFVVVAGCPLFFWGRGVAPRCASSGGIVGSAGRVPVAFLCAPADGHLRP